MPKSRPNAAEALQKVKADWVARGYRADYLADHAADRVDDPSGELAYQRAFAEAAKKEPPRLPNPSHYSNSPSAQTLIQKQNRGIFNSQQTNAPNPKYETPIPDMYWQSKEENQKHRSASSTPPISQGYPNSSPIQRNGYPSPTGGGYVTSPVGRGNPPILMEPRIGAPMGPPSNLSRLR